MISKMLLHTLATFLPLIATAQMPMPPSTGVDATIEGSLVWNAQQPWIRLDRSRAMFRLQGLDKATEASIRRLKSGDHLVGHGQIITAERLIRLESIDLVGLRTVLGVWRSNNQQVFNFRTFTRLSVSSAATNFDSKPREFQYSLAPASVGSAWSILLADHLGVRVGAVEVRRDRLRLTIYGNHASEPDQSWELSPVKP